MNSYPYWGANVQVFYLAEVNSAYSSGAAVVALA